MIGIIGAMYEEIVELKQEMKDISEIGIGNITFYRGILKNKEIVLVESGIGKVNASITTTLLINHFNVNKIIFTGVAGGVDSGLDIADMVIGTDLIQHDVDVQAFGYEIGQIPRIEVRSFECDKQLIDIAYKVAYKNFGDKVKKGRIVSGDQFIASNNKINWLREVFNASCTEMEGAAVAQVCYVLNVPFLIIRAISDKANHEATMDYPEFVKIAARNSKIVVDNILEEI